MVTEKNPRLQALREENEELQKKVKESEKKLANTNYKVLETETLQALSVKKKEEDQEMRKKLQAELEKWKDQFDETLKSNELKIERKLREAESAHIKELQADLLKEKHELIELQNKLAAIDKRDAEYIIEQANRTRQKVDLEAKKKINEELRKVLLDEIHEIDPSVNDLEDKVGKLKLQVRFNWKLYIYWIRTLKLEKPELNYKPSLWKLKKRILFFSANSNSFNITYLVIFTLYLNHIRLNWMRIWRNSTSTNLETSSKPTKP